MKLTKYCESLAKQALLVLCISLFAPVTRSQVVEQDSLALWSLYQHTYWPSGSIIHGWFQGPVSSFEGIEVTENRVTALRLDSIGIRATFPEALFNLDALVTFDFSHNNFYGPLPSGSGYFPNLRRLSLDHNNLTGEIPEWVYEIVDPVVWNVGHNKFTGSLDPRVSSFQNLQELVLGGNELAIGSIEFLREMRQLTRLDLSSIEFGPLPEWISELENLEVLILSDALPSGAVLPAGLGELSNLRILRLDQNRLRVPIPGWMSNLTALTELNLQNCRFTGPIPPSMGNLVELTHLNLIANDLTGPIPSSFGNLVRLEEFRAYNNDLSGSLPYSLGNLAELRYLNLHSNDLEGPIPESFGGLIAIDVFILNNNERMAGPFPNSLTQLGDVRQFSVNNTNLCVMEGSPVVQWARDNASGWSYCPAGTAIVEESPIESFSISTNFPNPFSTRTTILFVLPTSENVHLTVSDLTGRRVHSRTFGVLPAGHQSIVIDASDFSPGVYFYTLTAGAFTQTRKMILLR